MPIGFRAGFVGALLSVLPMLAGAQTTPATPPGAAAPQPVATTHVDGFRSAKWGMTEAQVKAAIRADFNIAEDKLKSTENPTEKTQVLTIVVPGLLGGGGNAQVSYILGFASQKLIQVKVVWSTMLDPLDTPQKIVAAADQLRTLFLGAGYDPRTIAVNTKMADGSILVFEGQDADKHTTLLHLATGTARTIDKDGKPGTPVAVAALSLSYILDARNPDIFRLKKGSL
ncbi:MAG TPA: hypothetical protein VK432_11640 [Stellaceae bacterium]|nr:hypothetical protein [Stellaceae bacterium]